MLNAFLTFRIFSTYKGFIGICIYMCVFVYVYIYMYVYICIYVCVYIHIKNTYLSSMA